jgi:glyoxylase-like metal-dependent hydrolase (beta-lactamase superfamily II)
MTIAPVELGRDRFLVDLGFRDTEGLIASYLLPEPDGWALVETGPTTVQGALVAGLRSAGIVPEDVRDVFVTHIHLDHAGGLGALARELPRAKFHAHRAGVPHLLDPRRLTESARRAWGAAADPLWGQILPVPPERLEPLDGGERFPLRDGHLEVLATPGHARHHVSYLDTGLRAILTGDSAGVRLAGDPDARPAVPPPDLDLGDLYASLDRMAERHPDTVLYTHFGPARVEPTLWRAYRARVEEWRAIALAIGREHPEVGAVAKALRDHESARAGAPGRISSGPAKGELVSGYELAAQGLLRYLRTHGELPAAP